METKYEILIIGGNRGIGFELVKRLSEKGHTVYATYRESTKDDPSVTDLKATAAETFEVDVLDEDSIIRAAKHFEGRKLDVLLNVAGVYYQWDEKPFSEHTAEDLLWHFRVNVVGPFLTSKYFLPSLSLSELGKIINITSDFASIKDNNTGGNIAYRISKAGVNQLSKTTAMDVTRLLGKGAGADARQPPNIKVLAVHPGFVATKMTAFQGDDDLDECMDGLVRTVERFGTETETETETAAAGAGADGIDRVEAEENGGYVRWDGKRMDY